MTEIKKVPSSFLVAKKLKTNRNSCKKEKDMSKIVDRRLAISALLEAGKTPTEISRDLQCARSLVYKVNKLKDDGKDVQPPPPKRKKTVMTPRVVAGLKRRIKAAPRKPLKVVAREAGVNRESVRKMVSNLGWRSLRRRKVPLLSAQGREVRQERAQGLLNNLKSGAQGRIVFFSDEKNFVVDPSYNAQNDRWIRIDATDHSAGYQATSKHPASAMFLGVVASTGEVSPPVWFKAGFRLDSATYIQTLQKTIIPWMRQVCLDHGTPSTPAPHVFQQDSAPAHRAHATVEFLKAQKIQFWTPEQWPPNSPDLNPLDYGIWSIVSEKACKIRPSSVKQLRDRVGAAWRWMDQNKIRRTCQVFRSRLEQCVEEKGSYFD